MYTAFLPCMPADQKRTPDLIIDGCEPPYGCWELNSGFLEEQAMLLPSEPSLQPRKIPLKVSFYDLQLCWTLIQSHYFTSPRQGLAQKAREFVIKPGKVSLIPGFT